MYYKYVLETCLFFHRKSENISRQNRIEITFKMNFIYIIYCINKLRNVITYKNNETDDVK